MNDRARLELSAIQLTRALVHEGVARFAAARLAQPDPLFAELLRDNALTTLLGQSAQANAWHAACRDLASLAPQLPGPLGRLLQDFRLQLPIWFLLGLAGEVEANPQLALAVAELQAPQRQPRPTLQLAAALCADLFDTPLPPLQLLQHPLLRSGILRLQGDGPLSLHSLAITPALWAVLGGDRTPWPDCRRLAAGEPEWLPATLREQFPQLAALLRAGQIQTVALRGAPRSGRLAAAQLAGLLGLQAVAIETAAWQSQPILAAACRYAGWLPVLTPHLGPGDQFSLLAQAGLPALPVPLIVLLGSEGAVEADGLVEIDIPGLGLAERRQIWRHALGDAMPAATSEQAELGEKLDSQLASQLESLLDGPAIVSLAERALLDARRLDQPLAAQHLAHARKQFGGERLRLLAQPVSQRVAAEALILPRDLQTRFDQLITRCRRREQLWDGLGVTLQSTANPGVRALFVGDSGTGKTLAAAHLATRLNAPLYRVDLAAVMNKYVGESEKNLGMVLDEAAANDVILLLDEADALFGRRSDGGENGERFANMLTNFLLTRIESHPGIVILTSNSRSRIDPAFTRRLDVILEFPAPGGDERLRLWQAHLGGRAPDEATCRLLAAYCDLAGGHIRNAVLNAAALAPTAADMALPAELLVAALADEYRKLGRDMPAQLKNIGRQK
jgi:hypothetical protein